VFCGARGSPSCRYAMTQGRRSLGPYACPLPALVPGEAEIIVELENGMMPWDSPLVRLDA
jgi:hypothetical protein